MAKIPALANTARVEIEKRQPKKKDPEPKESQAVMWKRRMLYLHPAVDKELRDLAHSDEERLHTILLRAIDFYLTTGRGKPSYLELTGREPGERPKLE